MGCGASKPKENPSSSSSSTETTSSKQTKESSSHHPKAEKPGLVWTPAPAESIESPIRFRLLEEPSGVLSYTMHALSVQFESKGPEVHLGLGVFGRSKLSWGPAGDDRLAEVRKLLKDAQIAVTEFVHDPMQFYSSETGLPYAALNAKLAGLQNRFLVDTRSGAFLGSVDLDKTIDAGVSIALEEQGIRGDEKLMSVMQGYVEGMRESLRQKCEAELREIWNMLAMWGGRLQYAPAPVPGSSPALVKVRRTTRPDPNVLTESTRANLDFAVRQVSEADAEIDRDEMVRLFREDLLFRSVSVETEEGAEVSEATMEPHVYTLRKVVSAEFDVRGEPHHSQSLLLKCLLFRRGEGGGPDEARDRNARVAQFTSECEAAFEALRKDNVGLSRQAELNIKEVFDAIDADGSGTIEIGELEAVMNKVSKGPVNPAAVAAAMKALDKNGDGKVQWTELRNYIANRVVASSSQGRLGEPQQRPRGDEDETMFLDVTRFFSLKLEGMLFVGPTSSPTQAKAYDVRLDRVAGSLEWSLGSKKVGRADMGSFTGVEFQAEAVTPAGTTFFPITLTSDRAGKAVHLFATSEMVRAKWAGALKRLFDASTTRRDQKELVETMKDAMTRSAWDAVRLATSGTANEQ
jgi:hypothetical protein